jgi:zinc protease
MVLLGAALVNFVVIRYGSFDADSIVEKSIFKEKAFSGKVEEVSAFGGKVKAYLMQEHSLPIVAVSFGFDKAGASYEPKNGVTLLLESTILDGAGRFSRYDIRDFMKEHGIKLGVSIDNDRAGFSLSFIKNKQKEALEVLKAVLYEPNFGKEDLDLVREQLKVSRVQRLESPQYLLSKLVRESFYGAHPYGKDSLATEEELEAISKADLLDYMREFWGKNNLTVGISGDISNQEAVLLLEEMFVGLDDEVVLADLPEFDADFNYKRDVVASDTSAQSFAVIMAKGIKRLDKDFYPLYLANQVLGGAGLNSKLTKAVREENGLTYGIYSYFSMSDAGELWNIEFSATPDNVDKIYEIAAKTYADFYNNGVSEEDLNLAKDSMLSSFNLRFSSLFNIASQLEMMQVEGLGIDFLANRQKLIKAVSLNDVNNAIKKYMPKELISGGNIRVFEISGKK